MRQIKTGAACIMALILTMLLSMSSYAAIEPGNEDPGGAEQLLITEESQLETADGMETDVQDETEEVPGNGDESEKAAEDNTEIDTGETEPEEVRLQSERPAVLKAANGERVSYTGKRVGSNAGETTVFSVSTGGTAYTGACAEQGVAMKSSGHASITRIGNGTKIAKVIYYFAIALGNNNWWSSDHKTDKVGKIIGMDHAGDTDVTKRRMVEVFCQIYNMGASEWYNTVTSSSGGGWSTSTAKKVRDYYKNLDVSNITVPSSFEIWFAKSENKAQSFIMWANKPAGYVTVKKISGDSSVTG